MKTMEIAFWKDINPQKYLSSFSDCNSCLFKIRIVFVGPVLFYIKVSPIVEV